MKHFESKITLFFSSLKRGFAEPFRDINLLFDAQSAPLLSLCNCIQGELRPALSQNRYLCWSLFSTCRFCSSFVFQLHTDLDKGDSAVKYTLSGDGAGSIFTIDQTTGDIHALRSLDREEKPYYTLRAQAVDINTNRPLEPESEFVIKVQDINDNEPKFLEGPYRASVPEMSPVGMWPHAVTRYVYWRHDGVY